MDGLIIKEKWIEKILSGQKTMEIRGSQTKKIGDSIYLLFRNIRVFVYEIMKKV